MISSFTSNNWVTILIFLMIGSLVLLRNLYPIRYTKFFSLSRTNEYFIDYINKSNTGFNFFESVLFVFQIATFSLLLVKVNVYFNINETAVSFFMFGKISLYLFIYSILRLLLGKFIAVLVNMKKQQKNLTFIKMSYTSKVATIIFPAVIFMYYGTIINETFTLFLLGVTVLFLGFKYIQIVLKNQKLIFSNLFYFILYLCALEIAPLIYVYKLFIINM